MTEGIVTDLKELIGLRRYARSVAYHPEGKAVRFGSHASKLRGRGMDFSEARNYQAGDEIRHMEWRVTARTGRPHVKIYQEERERPVVLVVDFNPSMLFGTRGAFKSVIAARLAALLAWTVVAQGDRVGGFFFSAQEHREFLPQSRDSAVLPLLAALTHFSQQGLVRHDEPARAFSDGLARLRRVIRPGSILVFISDFYTLGDDYARQVNRLREHNDILMYHVCDMLELVPPKPQQYVVSNGQQELLFDTRTASVRQAYEQYCQQRCAQLQAQCTRLQIQYVQATAQVDLALLARQTFPRRSRG